MKQKEIEEIKSSFETTSPKKIIAASGVSKNYPPSTLQFKTSKKGPKFLHTILSRLYTFADDMTQQTSFIVQDLYRNETESFDSILQLLKAEKIIKNSQFINQRYHDAPSFLRCDIYPSYRNGSTDGYYTRNASGHGFDKDKAKVLSRAVGEFLERYFLTLYHQNQFTRSSQKLMLQKGFSTLDLTTLAGFSVEQKQKHPSYKWDENSMFSWEKLTRVKTGETVYTPAQLIYWNYALAEGEPLLREPNTNGGGGMFTKEGALLAGIYELIERDTFLIFWLNKITPPQIAPDTIPDNDFQNLLHESRRYGFEVYCLNTTLDLAVPSFVVVLSDPSGKTPRFALGGRCHSNPLYALRRALEEAWHIYYSNRERPVHSLPRMYKPFQDKSIGRAERLGLSSNPAMERYYRFLVQGEKRPYTDVVFTFPSRFNTEKEELDFLVNHIENTSPGHEVYCYCVSHPLLSRLGYCVVKVVIPNIIPLFLNETRAPLGSRRLREVPLQFHFQTSIAFNSHPHPFP